MASGDQDRRQTHLFLNGDVYDHGAVALALGGAYMVRTIVSQGATPIGEPWIITGAEGQVIHTIARRPAYEVLVETLRELPAEMQARARGNLLVGLAMDEYQQEFRRGDFLIRNLLGVDRDSGVLVVSALPGVGQTVQFQIRDAAAASEDLHAMLGAVTATQGEQPVAALLCACNGRGVGLFGTPGHDARTLAERLGPIPVVGLFCNGEIGPVGSRNFLHGFTASIALVVPRESAG
jgi:small ligand-binding sensory domain FIST